MAAVPSAPVVRAYGFWLTMLISFALFLLMLAITYGGAEGLFALRRLLRQMNIPLAGDFWTKIPWEMLPLPFAVLLLVFGLAIFVRHRGGLFAYCGLRLPAWREWLYGGVLFLALGSGAEWLLRYFGIDPITVWQRALFADCSGTGLLVLFGMLVLLPPIWEELFFRGFLYTGLSASFLRAPGAIVLPSILWALLHVQYDPAIIGAIFSYGLLLGYLRWRSESLLLCMVLHFFNNLASYVVTYYAVFGANA